MNIKYIVFMYQDHRVDIFNVKSNNADFGSYLSKLSDKICQISALWSLIPPEIWWASFTPWILNFKL